MHSGRLPFALALAAAWLGVVSVTACSSGTPVVVPDSGPPALLQPGAACDAGGQCDSQICLGRCCAKPCNTDSAHPECSACDATGACGYPAVLCRAAACDPVARTATSEVACANGSCPAATLAECSAGCDGDHCGSGCRSDQDCASGYRCAFDGDGGSIPLTTAVGTCALQLAGGQACLVSDQCQSGVCLAGTCCNGPCTTDPLHPECSACDANGNCSYPTTTCAASFCDSTTDSQVAARACQQGVCGPQLSISCGSYRCDAQQRAVCRSSCMTDPDCAEGAFCAPTSGSANVCCPLLADQGILYADVVSGKDTPCCGLTPSTACQSMGQAYAVSAFSYGKSIALGFKPASHFTLRLTYDGGAGDWQTPPPGVVAEGTTPVPCGVVIQAAGINLPPMSMGGGDDTCTGGLEGTTAEPVMVGINAGNFITGGSSISGGGTFSLSNVIFFGGLQLTGSASPTTSTTVNLGLASDGDAGGLVQFGWDETQGKLNGHVRAPATQGLTVKLAQTSTTQLVIGGPVAVRDVGSASDSVVRVFNQVPPPPGVFTQSPVAWGVYIGDQVTASFTHHLQIAAGTADSSYAGQFGIVNAGILTLNGASITGQAIAGLFLASGLTTLSDSSVADNGCYGAWVASEYTPSPTAPFNLQTNQSLACQVSGGCLGGLSPVGGVMIAARTSFVRNFIGVFQGVGYGSNPEGQFTDLSGGDGGPGGNIVACNDASHAAPNPVGFCPPYDNASPGANLWNLSSNQVNASNVAWGPGQPLRWTCDPTMNPSSCYGSDGGAYDAGTLSVVSTPDPSSGDAGAILLLNPAHSVTCP